MKKSLLPLICLATMMAASISLKAQEVTITLNPGWTWISYPRADTLDLTSALGTFTPVNGDLIKSRYGFSEYYNNEWYGNLHHFYPGLGYVYMSNRTEPVTLTFQMQQSTPQVVVNTSEPTNITAVSAMVGGTVTIDEDSHVYIHGICYDTVQMPTVDGRHTSNTSGTSSFTTTLIGLIPSTTYYVRAYIISDYGLVYGEQQSFTTEFSSGNPAYVDLDLPSGLLWATCNVGADSPEEYGDYFAFGEIQPKNDYTWSNYQYCNGNYNQITKYCANTSYGYNGFVDYLFILLPEDDVATVNWGENWRMPTKYEWRELFQNTTPSWTAQNGVNGILFTASNGNTLFLPATGYQQGNFFYGVGNHANYWSSTVNTDNSCYADVFFLNSSGHSYSLNNCYRYYGQPVRPVYSVPQK